MYEICTVILDNGTEHICWVEWLQQVYADTDIVAIIWSW